MRPPELNLRPSYCLRLHPSYYALLTTYYLLPYWLLIVLLHGCIHMHTCLHAVANKMIMWLLIVLLGGAVLLLVFLQLGGGVGGDGGHPHKNVTLKSGIR